MIEKFINYCTNNYVVRIYHAQSMNAVQLTLPYDQFLFGLQGIKYFNRMKDRFMKLTMMYDESLIDSKFYFNHESKICFMSFYFK